MFLESRGLGAGCMSCGSGTRVARHVMHMARCGVVGVGLVGGALGSMIDATWHTYVSSMIWLRLKSCRIFSPGGYFLIAYHVALPPPGPCLLWSDCSVGGHGRGPREGRCMVDLRTNKFLS